MHWDPDFLDRSPMLASLAFAAESLRALREWPTRKALQELLAARGVTNTAGTPLRLVEPSRATGAYEARIYARGELEVREGEWHDLFNVLAWLAYRRSKAALNERHNTASRPGEMRDSAAGARVGRRGRVRDALTLFDESGAIVVSSEPDLLEDVRAFRWKRLFSERRECVRRAMRFYLFGHALFEKALQPYVGMTAHAMLLPVVAGFMDEPLERQTEALDERIAAAIRGLANPQSLAPLPVLGVPGWWNENESEAFYDNAAYFRPGRTRML